MKTGALASGAASLGLVGTAAGQEGGNETGNETGGGGGRELPGEALMFNDEFRPGAQFQVVSGTVSETPELQTGDPEILADLDARIVRYLNTDERVLLFVQQNTTVEEGAVYELQQEFTPAPGGTGEGIVAVRLEPVPEDERVLGPEFDVDDLPLVEGGGKALVRADNLHPGALLRVVSGVVEWTPPPDVAGSDVLSEYNTRHAEYLNANDEFLLYPARSASIDRGGVYVIRQEFDITDPEGNLVTVDLDRVDEEEFDDGLV